MEEFICVYSSRTVVLNLPNTSTLNTAPHVVVTPTHKIFLFLLHNCNFATVMNHFKHLIFLIGLS